MESSPKAISTTSYASLQVFPRFWQNLMYTCSISSVNLCVMTMRNTRGRVPWAKRSRYVRKRSQDVASLGNHSYQRNNTSLDNVWTALVALHTLSSATYGGVWSVSHNDHFMPRKATPRTTIPHWKGGWVGPKTSLDKLEKRKILSLPETKPWFFKSSAHRLVPILTMLSWLWLLLYQMKLIYHTEIKSHF